MSINIQKNIILSDFTTIGLGGKAKYFAECRTVKEIYDSLEFALKNKLSVQIMSGGSNIIFRDEGFEGIVIKIDLKGMELTEKGMYEYAKVSAGENWDEFVIACIGRGLSGIECLSGIPGSAGATPIQNVGAYGQEVKDIIVSVTAIDRSTLKIVTFNNEDCNFGYRQSRFKNRDKDKYIITEINFRFKKNAEPLIKYTDLQKLLDSRKIFERSKDLREKLYLIRDAVLDTRKGKSMLIDKSDPNSKSCGSFFMNPLLNDKDLDKLKSAAGMNAIPVYQSGNKNKIPAAWLIEKAGFHKGYIKNGVGISKNHSLALININGTTRDLLDLAEEIEQSVFYKFGIRLCKEPVIV